MFEETVKIVSAVSNDNPQGIIINKTDLTADMKIFGAPAVAAKVAAAPVAAPAPAKSEE